MSKIKKRDKNPNTPEVTSKYYLSNSKMLPEVIKSKQLGYITNELAQMLMMLTTKYSMRPCFIGYTNAYKEDMISEALANLCKNALKFNPEKSDNPFSFYTTCIHNSFLQTLSAEKNHRKIRDTLLIDIGENPSYNFLDEMREHGSSDYSSDFQELRSEIEEAKQRLLQETSKTNQPSKEEKSNNTKSLLNFDESNEKTK